MCQKRTDSQKPLSGACAKVQGQATAQLQLSNQSPVMCQLGISVMRISKPKSPVVLKKNYSGSRDTPGSNLRCNCSASERVSTIVWNAAATFCEKLSGALGIGFLSRAFLTTDLDFFDATA